MSRLMNVECGAILLAVGLLGTTAVTREPDRRLDPLKWSSLPPTPESIEEAQKSNSPLNEDIWPSAQRFENLADEIERDSEQSPQAPSESSGAEIAPPGGGPKSLNNGQVVGAQRNWNPVNSSADETLSEFQRARHSLIDVLSDDVSHGYFDHARRRVDQEVEVFRGIRGDDHWQTREIEQLQLLIGQLAGLGRVQRSELLDIRKTVDEIHRLHSGTSACKEAAGLAERTRARCKELIGTENRLYADCLEAVIHTRWDESNRDLCRMCQEVVDIRTRLLGPRHPDVGWAFCMLGSCQVDSDGYSAAEKSLEEAFEILQDPDADPSLLVHTAHKLVNCYVRTGKAERAYEISRLTLPIAWNRLRPKSAYHLVAYVTHGYACRCSGRYVEAFASAWMGTGALERLSWEEADGTQFELQLLWFWLNLYLDEPDSAKQIMTEQLASYAETYKDDSAGLARLRTQYELDLDRWYKRHPEHEPKAIESAQVLKATLK